MGPAHPSFQHGRYSKYLPSRLKGRFEEALADPSLLELRPEIALIDSRISELIGTLNNDAPVSFGALWSRHKTAVARGDASASKRIADEIDSALQAAEHREQMWAKLGAEIDRRMRLVESERKRLVQLQEFVAAEQLRVLLVRVQQLIEDNVKDRGALINITNGLYALTNN